MLRKVIGTVVIVLVLFLSYIALQNPNYKISRQQIINASPEAIFPWINNSKKTNEWMPWKDSDPNVQMKYSGPDEGVGSVSSWDSSGNMGVGKAEVVESIPNKLVKTQLTYTKPMEMSQLAEISLAPAANGTMVTWSVSGTNNFIGRVFCFFMNMDKMVGGEFEKGLTNLRKIVEKP
jgi:hypothetical protein